MNDTTTAAITITTTATRNTRGRPRGKRRGHTTSDCSSRGDRRGRGGRGGRRRDGRRRSGPSRQARGPAVGVGRPLQAPQHVRDVARLDAVHYLAGVCAEYITTTTAATAGASTCSSSLPGSLTARLGSGVAQKPTRTVRKDSQVKD
jgi:hypothetical protein